MTTNGIAQYDALQWAWNLAKEYDTCVHCREMQQLRDHIEKALAQIAESGEMDFKQVIRDLRAGNY